MEFRILGPLEVIDGASVVRVASGHERRLLLFLLIRAPRPAPLHAIVDALWPDDPPSSAQKVVQNYVLRLRKALGQDAIGTVADGYALVAGPESVDAWVAGDLLGRAKEALAAGDADEASRLTREALALWRGDALADVRDEPFARPEAARLDELRLTAVEEAFEASLAAGAHRELVPELRQHVALYPLRERPRAQLMLALYRSGRQADALAEYRSARSALAEQGLEPERALRELEAAMLNQAPELDAAPRARAKGTVDPPRAAPRRGVAAILAAVAVAAILAVVLTQRGPARSVSSLRRDTLAELDPVSGRVERSFIVGRTPTAVAISPGAVWTTSFDDRTVTRVDLHSGRTSVVGSPSTPTAIAYGAGSVWVASAFDGAVERLDPASGAVLAVVHLQPGLAAIASGAGRMWAANELHGSLASIDPRTNARRTASTTGLDRPTGVAFGARRVWVTEEGARRLDAVDPATGKIVLRIPLDLRPGAVTYGAGALWIIDPADAAVTRVDAFTGRQQVISVGQVPSRIAIAGGRVWIALDRDHELALVDASTGDVVKRLGLARAKSSASGRDVTPGGLAASGDAVWLAVQAI